MFSKIRGFLSLFILLLTVFVFCSVKLSYAAGPSLEFQPSSMNLGVGERLVVDILIDTAGNEVGGCGAKIEYDPEVVSAVTIEPGEIFNDYPTSTFDNEAGKAVLSGIVNSADNLYKGRGKFGSMTFQAVSSGMTKVKFEFEKGSTTDSNIAVSYGNGDILESVNELSIRVTDDTGGGENLSVPANSASITSTLQENETTQENGIVHEKVSVIDQLLGLIGLRGRTESQIDPYGPIPSQSPNTNPDFSQPTQQMEYAGRPDYSIYIILFIVAALFVVLFVIIKKRIKSKKTSTTVVQSEM